MYTTLVRGNFRIDHQELDSLRCDGKIYVYKRYNEKDRTFFECPLDLKIFLLCHRTMYLLFIYFSLNIVLLQKVGPLQVRTDVISVTISTVYKRRCM